MTSKGDIAVPQGYHGKILWVDLGEQRFWEQELDEAVYRRFFGGYGLGVKVLFDALPGGVDPLGPENILGFVPGLLTGTGVPYSGRFSVVCKSPLTGGWGDSNCGGVFGPELRRCGYDGIFIRGVAPAPTLLYVSGGQVEFHPAGDLWGQDAVAAEAACKQRFGARAQAAVIGQAGEGLSLISGIVNDAGRLAARSGVGAVMGSKRLKALVCKGHITLRKADMAAYRSASAAILKPLKGIDKPATQQKLRLLETALQFGQGLFVRLKLVPQLMPAREIMQFMAAEGTTCGVSMGIEAGDSPVKNWAGLAARDFPWQRSSKISNENAIQYNTRPYACSACPLHCGAEVSMPGGPIPVAHGHRPEYETLCGFGGGLLIDSHAALVTANLLCNHYGLDSISTAAVCAFAFECFEKGLITAEQCEGHALTWGNAAAMLALIQMIGERRAIGDLLADGVRRAAERLGGGSEAWAMHAGGQELPYHDPKLSPSFATTYVTDPTPGRHTAGGWGYGEIGYMEPIFPHEWNLPRLKRFQYTGKGQVHAAFGNAMHITQITGMCQFSNWEATLPYAEAIRAGTGWELTSKDLLAVGERVQNLRQCFNVREGIRPGDFKLPDRAVGRPPLAEGPTKGITVDVQTLAREYYAAMGWDPETGRPSAARLRALGLEEALAALYREVAAD